MSKAVKNTASHGLLIRDKIIDLLNDNKTSGDLTKLNINNVVTDMPANVRPPILHVATPKLPEVRPIQLGRKHVTYMDVYIIPLIYIHSDIDRKLSDSFLLSMDILTDFFISHSELEGLTTMGLELHNVQPLNYITDRYIYRAVEMEIVVPVVRKRNRGNRY